MGGVTVSDSAGLIMRLALDRSPARAPLAPFATAGIGKLGAAWAWGIVSMRACFGAAGMRIEAMSPRFGFGLGARLSLAIASRECPITFPKPKLIG